MNEMIALVAYGLLASIILVMGAIFLVRILGPKNQEKPLPLPTGVYLVTAGGKGGGGGKPISGLTDPIPESDCVKLSVSRWKKPTKSRRKKRVLKKRKA